MPSVRAQLEALDQMNRALRDAMNELQQARAKIASAKSDEWNDEKSVQFQEITAQIGEAVESPIGILADSQRYIVKLKAALEEYNKIGF